MEPKRAIYFSFLRGLFPSLPRETFVPFLSLRVGSTESRSSFLSSSFPLFWGGGWEGKGEREVDRKQEEAEQVDEEQEQSNEEGGLVPKCGGRGGGGAASAAGGGGGGAAAAAAAAAARGK